MPTYILSAIAKDDLLDVWLDIFELTKNAEFAENFVDSFTIAFEKVSKNPGMGESRDYLRPGFRKWTHRKYIIYYKPQNGMTRIERILWGRSQQLLR